MPLVRRTVNQIDAGATRMAPRGTHRSGSGKVKPGVNLPSSLLQEVGVRGDSVVGSVGSTKEYAATAHQGSEAHYIYAKGKMLKFEWERGRLLVQRRSRGRRTQRVFFFKKVRHPGNKRPVRYLTTPMHMYGRLNGFRTTSSPVSRTRLP